MLTLYTLPICPRCEMIKTQLAAAGIEYEENTDPTKAEEFSDKFWPIGIDEDGRLYEFPDLLSYIQAAPNKPNQTIPSISLPNN